MVLSGTPARVRREFQPHTVSSQTKVCASVLSESTARESNQGSSRIITSNSWLSVRTDAAVAGGAGCPASARRNTLRIESVLAAKLLATDVDDI